MNESIRSDSALEHTPRTAAPPVDFAARVAAVRARAGVVGLDDITALPKVTKRLEAAGYSDADLAKMWSGNVLRLLGRASLHPARSFGAAPTSGQ